MVSNQVFNWDRQISTRPARHLRPQSVQEVADIVKDARTHPSPVRAVGSMHSPTRCLDADGGTLLDMRGLDHVEISADRTTVTAGAGAAYIDAATKLEQAGLQFEVNAEIGNFTFGSGAVAGSKDASMVDPDTGELRPGQVSSHVTRIQLVDARGSVRDITDPDELRLLRSSYGLLGIVTEVTMQVKPLAAISVEHRRYSLDQFVEAFPKLARDERRSMFMYMFPFRNRIVVELRGEPRSAGMGGRWPWVLRNLSWRKINPTVARLLEMWPKPLFRYWLIDRWNAATAWVLDRVLEGRATSPTAQILRFPDRGGLGRFGFTFWAFPEQKYPEILSAYFDFCREHKKRSGYRTNLPHVSYRIARDQNALLSYSHDHVVATLDPAASPSAGFDDFLRAFNKFAIERGGKPMLNQTKWLDAELLLRAYGERWRAFAQIRQQWDPEDRFLSAHFRALLPDHPPEEADLAAE